jgi:hypothetical protein
MVLFTVFLVGVFLTAGALLGLLVHPLGWWVALGGPFAVAGDIAFGLPWYRRAARHPLRVYPTAVVLEGVPHLLEKVESVSIQEYFLRFQLESGRVRRDYVDVPVDLVPDFKAVLSLLESRGVSIRPPMKFDRI